jgi:hypothetical protein
MKLHLTLLLITFPFFLFAQKQDTTCICGSLTPDISKPIIVEIMPEYPGGKEALKHLIESNIILKKTSNGKIEITFLIGCEGSTCGIEVIKNDQISKDIEDQLIKILRKMEIWKPAKQRDKPIDVAYLISVSVNNGILSFNRI